MYIFEKIFACRISTRRNARNAIASFWMHLSQKRLPEFVRRRVYGAGAGWSWSAATQTGLATVLILAGCASPGPPLPPTLNLPQVVSSKGLTAMRVGDEVQLHWTTPSRTTDKLQIAGPVTAEICRTPLNAPPPASARQDAGGAKARVAPPCSPVVDRVQVARGDSEAVDKLPVALAAGPAGMLAYRVQLANEADRTAGPSPLVVVASGAAPRPVEDLRGHATKAGVVLEWKPELGMGATGEAIELERTRLESVTAATAPPAKTASGGLGLPDRNSRCG